MFCVCTGCALMGECVGAGGRCRAETVSFRGVPEHETRDADARLEEYRVSESQKLYANRAQGQNEASALRQHCSAIVGGQDKERISLFLFFFVFPLFLPLFFFGVLFFLVDASATNCCQMTGKRAACSDGAQELVLCKHRRGGVIGSPTFCHFR